MPKSLLLVMLIFAICEGISPAADVIWTNGTGDGLWTTGGNWNPPFEPKIAYKEKAVINRMDGPLIRDGMAAECQWLVVSDGSPATMHMTGGTLNVSAGTTDTWTIVAYRVSDVGAFTIDGGIITTSNRVFVGFQGEGTMIMNGGTFNIGGTFGIGYGETSYNTGKGYVYLNGGTINVAESFVMSSPEGAVGRLDICGGTLNLDGDKRTVVAGYVSNGYIVAYDGMGIVHVDYDGTKTILTGQMNPYLARVPQPDNEAEDVAPYVALGWIAGDTAITQDIYLGADADAVLNADTSATGVYRGSQSFEDCSFEPRGLELSKTYYWRIDSVDATTTHKGNLWHFTVAEYALVDDFETYADSSAMGVTWSDEGTGASLSLASTDGREGSQALKFDYDNGGAGSKPYYSEVRTVGIDYDWTVSGVLAMDVWYKGAVTNSSEPMYVALEDGDGHPIAVVVNSDANVVKADDWQVWRIELSAFSGLNLANIKKLYLGFGDRDNPVAGGTGTVYFDDIALFPSRCLFAVIGDIDNDCDVDFDDFALMAGNWLCVSGI